jgi:citrate/tricarballylate utilization protein
MAQESQSIAEARQFMEVCNACRYCESYCAVFPAMTMRRAFTEGDLTHLANLCHGCKGCYHACQYAPPHAFGINIPRNFAEIRNETYAKHAWPAPLGAMFERNGTIVSLVAALGVALALVLTVALQDPSVLWSAQRGAGAFFRVVPHWLMITLGVATFGFAIIAMAMGARSYWRATGGGGGGFAPAPAAEAAMDIATMRNLGGGGHGCNDLDDGFSTRRRWLHQALMYGFLLCFAATCTGTIYHYVFGWYSPHAFLSLPVQFGFWGGVLMMIGTAGLTHVKIITDPGPVSRKVMGGEFAILGLLFLIAATGLLLLAVRHTGAMGLMLAIHLGLVFAFFLVMPYSKMVHGLYRGIALLRHAQEKRRAGVAAAAA